MKNQELYNKTVNILVQAYFNDTLQHTSCTACAVGNIIQSNMQLTPCGDHMEWAGGVKAVWANVFCTEKWLNEHNVVPENYKGLAKAQIDSTGYTWPELSKIEHAFEMANSGDSNEEWMFNGLMAVIEVLDQIHENTDEATTAKSKALFVKA